MTDKEFKLFHDTVEERNHYRKLWTTATEAITKTIKDEEEYLEKIKEEYREC